MAPLITGFEIASLRGPLCDEPVIDVHFVLESVEEKSASDQSAAGATASSGAPKPAGAAAPAAPAVASTPSSQSRTFLSGHMIAAVRDGCAEAMLRRSTCRIAEPVLLLDLQCEGSSMGKVYGVLGKRRCQTLEEGFREGTSVFLLKIKIPMVESFNLSNEIRHVASGEVHYHARFLGFEKLGEDPFAEQSRTQEEVEVEGDFRAHFPSAEGAQSVSRKILTSVRKRKGMAIDERVVKDAQKQRTMTKMK